MNPLPTNKGAKPRKSIRVIDQPDGTVKLSDSDKAREGTGLSFHAASERFYRIDPVTSKRVYHGRDATDVTAAVAEFTGQEPIAGVGK